MQKAREESLTEAWSAVEWLLGRLAPLQSISLILVRREIMVSPVQSQLVAEIDQSNRKMLWSWSDSSDQDQTLSF